MKIVLFDVPHYDTEEAAELVNLSPLTLQNMRPKGEGPNFTVGAKGRVLYPEPDLKEWFLARKCCPSREPTAKLRAATKRSPTKRSRA